MQHLRLRLRRGPTTAWSQRQEYARSQRMAPLAALRLLVARSFRAARGREEPLALAGTAPTLRALFD